MNTRELHVSVQFRGSTTKAFVTVYGDETKPQILCLHGIGSSGQESFRSLAEQLSDEYQMVAIDWLGWGQSSRPLGEDDTYDADYCSAWFREFISSATEQGVLRPQFSVLAISMSAIPLAITHKSIETHLNSIILINPAGLDTRINRVFAFVLTNSWFSHQKIARLLLRRFVWKNILGRSDFHWQRLNDGLANGELELFVRYAKAGIMPDGRMRQTHVVPDKFAEITKPVLLIHSRDHIFYQQQYLHFAHSRKNWQTVYIDSNGHTPSTQRPHLVAREIQRFLNTI